MTLLTRFLVFPLIAVVLGFGSSRAQPAINPPAAPGGLPPALPAPASGALPVEDSGPRLDFAFQNLPLLEAIKLVQAKFHEASGKYLNVMVPEHLRELAETNTLTLDVKQVTVGELFKLLGMASERTVFHVNGYSGSIGGRPTPSFSQTRGGYRFVPVNASGGNPTFLLTFDIPTDVPNPLPSPGRNADPSEPAEPAKVMVYFFQLEPYLDRYKIEDITTAVKTGWDLAGFKTRPTLKYHEETKLLVVAGATDQVQMVEQVLRALTGSNGRPSLRRGDLIAPPVQPALPAPAAKP